MAHVYDSARQYFASGSINLATQTLGVTLVNTTLYTFNAGHDMLNDIPVASRIATSSLTNVAVSSGRLDADNLDIASEGVGFPATPDGGTVTVNFQASDPFILKI